MCGMGSMAKWRKTRKGKASGRQPYRAYVLYRTDETCGHDTRWATGAFRFRLRRLISERVRYFLRDPYPSLPHLVIHVNAPGWVLPLEASLLVSTAYGSHGSRVHDQGYSLPQ